MHPPPGSSPLPQKFPLFGHSQHEVQFYSDDDVLLDGVESLLRGAVKNGDGAICVATKKHLVALAKRLKANDQGMAAAAEQGRYLSLDVADVLSAVMSKGSLDEARATEFFGNALTKTTAVLQGKSRVVVFGETVAALWAEGKIDSVLKLEQLWNDRARQNALALRCAYPIQTFRHPRDAEYFQSICEEHSAVIVPEAYPEIAGSEPVGAAIPSDQWLGQARQSIESETELSYPEWQVAYREALLEMNPTRLFKRVEVAQAAVLTRLHALQGETNHHAERHHLMQAWRVLRMIKREKLGFYE